MRYTIRELKLGEILDQAVNLTKDHFGVLLGITGVLMIPFYVLGGLIQVSMIPKLPPNPTPEQAAAVTFGAMRVSLPFGLLVPTSLPRLQTPPSFTRSPMPTSKSRSVWEDHSSGPFSGFSRSSAPGSSSVWPLWAACSSASFLESSPHSGLLWQHRWSSSRTWRDSRP